MSLRTVKTKVAVFRFLEHDFECVYSETMNDASDLVRVSDYVEVSFTSRAEEELVPAIIASLDKEADAIREKAIEKLNKIAAYKAEVLQITYIPSEEL
jgi:hypothetical protein